MPDTGSPLTPTLAPEPAPRPGLTALAARLLSTPAMRASAWTMAGFAISQFVRFGGNWEMTRLLTPELFGLMGLAQVFLTGLDMFSDIGIGPSLIQHARGEDADFANTAWTIQVLRGFLLWGAACLLAWPASVFFHRPELRWLMPVVGVTAAINGFRATALFTLNRRLAFRALTLVSLAIQALTVVCMIAWAWVWPNVWALVASALANHLLYAVLSRYALPGIRNRFRWDRAALHDLVHFGRWIFLSTVLTFLGLRGDQLLLGRLVPAGSEGAAQLGVYFIGLMLASFPVEVISRLVTAVLFPVLSRHHRDRPEVLHAQLLRARRLLLPVGLAGALGVALVAPSFFGYLYKPRYWHAGWMAQLLSVSAWFSILAATGSAALLAKGNSRALALANGARVVATVIGCLVGHALAGLPGFILGAGAGAWAGHVVIQIELRRCGLSILKQDLAYTGLLGAVALIALAPPALLRRLHHPSAAEPVALVLATTLLLVLAAWVAQRFRREFLRR